MCIFNLIIFLIVFEGFWNLVCTYLFRRMVRGDIGNMYSEQTRSLKDLLSSEECKYISLTVDLWSDRRMRSYMGVTAHFIENDQLSRAVLCCQKFDGLFYFLWLHFELRTNLGSCATRVFTSECTWTKGFSKDWELKFSTQNWDWEIISLYTFSFTSNFPYISSLLLHQNLILDVDAFFFAIPVHTYKTYASSNPGNPAPPAIFFPRVILLCLYREPQPKKPRRPHVTA